MLLLLPALAIPLVAAAPQSQSLTPVGRDVFGVSPEEKEILSHLSIVMLPDGQGGLVKTLRISGINVQIVNGLGSTDTTNGLGNLIVGYNEPGQLFGDDRTGSHNIVGGRVNSFASFGGLVVGTGNTIAGRWATVTGGRSNTASGDYTAVSGGFGHSASGRGSSVSGGFVNTASGDYASVSGGSLNEATGSYSSVGGGLWNYASGFVSSVSGGRVSRAIGKYASVSGGDYNHATGFGSSISGGYVNVASGRYSTVSGGSHRTVTGDFDWAAGSLFEDD